MHSTKTPEKSKSFVKSGDLVNTNLVFVSPNVLTTYIPL